MLIMSEVAASVGSGSYNVEPMVPQDPRKSGWETKSPDVRESLMFHPGIATLARWNGPEKIYDNRNGFYWVRSSWARRYNFLSKGFFFLKINLK